MAYTVSRSVFLLFFLQFFACASGITAATESADRLPVLYSDALLSARPGSVLQLTGINLINCHVALLQKRPHRTYRDLPSRHDQPQAVQVIAQSNNPDRLAILVPADIDIDAEYEISVVTEDGVQSNTLSLNTATPMWFTPATMVTSNESGKRPATLKIIGRNLRCRNVCTARLSGPEQILLTRPEPEPDEAGSAIANFLVPANIPAGDFRVEYSADNTTWLPIGGIHLKVVNARSRKSIALDEQRFGKCLPNDELDDRNCLQRALDFAATGDFVVTIPPGRWDIHPPQHRGSAMIAVPRGVWIQGTPRGNSLLVGHSDDYREALLMLNGENEIRYLSTSNTGNSKAAALIQLGSTATGTTSLRNITIEDNYFRSSGNVIADSGVPVENLKIRRNEFFSAAVALHLIGNKHQATPRFSLINSTISDNTFHASGMSRSRNEFPIASEIGGSSNLDFSRNRALATGNEKTKTGWRAGYFFHLQENHENLLVEDNLVECAGSGGDGEAIALDNNGNASAFPYALPVVATSEATVTVQGFPDEVQNGTLIGQVNYYRGMWLQLVHGRGAGQTRRIIGYETNPHDHTTTYAVSPSFTVLPAAAASKVFISRLFTAPTLAGNTVNNHLKQCANGASTAHGGAISLWAQTHNGLVENNRLHDSDGIVVKHVLGALRNPSACKDCEPGMIRHVNLDISGNRIINTCESSCATSGITLRFGAAPVGDPSLPVIGLNTRITGNLISNSTSAHGNAVSFFVDWYTGPPGSSGSLIDGSVVDGNLIEYQAPAPACASCQPATSNNGIGLSGGHLIRGTMLHDNRCRSVINGLMDGASTTVRICGESENTYCGCTRR